LAESERPSQFMTIDQSALAQMQQGILIPHHIAYKNWLMHLASFSFQIQELAKIAEYAEEYLKQKLKMKGKTVANTNGNIFIGHGGSSSWLELQNFIQNRLNLIPDEFNREPTAGISITERLETMLDNASLHFWF
jgi:hypothetical protein